MYSVIITPSARKDLRRVPQKLQAKIGKEINKLAKNPHMGKKLEGDHAGQYVVRVWPYRIIYEIHKKEVTVIILKIWHRQGVYK